jgi:hypothetical protein
MERPVPGLANFTTEAEEIFMSPFTKGLAVLSMAGAVLVAASIPSEARWGGHWGGGWGHWGGHWGGWGTAAAVGAGVGLAAGAAVAAGAYGPGYYGYPYGGAYAYAPYAYGPVYRNGTTWVPGTSSPRVDIQ